MNQTGTTNHSERERNEQERAWARGLGRGRERERAGVKKEENTQIERIVREIEISYFN